ncbi:MAG: hypothetical protein LH478_15370 [Chitinophagaceae bacterium]|nr:hypothetical protein [Chitinophagaceae bacterium]
MTGSLGWEMGVTLADKVYAKHLADGVISRLYTGWRMLTGLYVTGHKLDTCLQKHKLAERLRIDPETAYRKRDHLYEEVTQILRVNKNALKGKFTLNLKKIGAWGFEIDDTPPVKKIKPKQ